MRTETMIGVADVEKSSAWYQRLLGCRGTHGGPWFERLENSDGDVVLLLCRWGGEAHPSLRARPDGPPGSGVEIYLRAESDEALRAIRERAGEMGAQVLGELAYSELAHQDEFMIRDPDGYVLTLCGVAKDAPAQEPAAVEAVDA
jgi:catechol 2,3-dioxygenase-like lactoylglutathione lyase family enzyme